MAMGSDSKWFYNPMSGFENVDDTFLTNFNQSNNFPDAFLLKENHLDLSFMCPPIPPLDPNPSVVSSTMSGGSDVDSPDDSDDNVLKFLNSILMEDDIEQKPSMFHDPLALQAAERSLYDAIGEKYPRFPNQTPLYFNYSIDSPDNLLFGSYSEQTSFSNMRGNHDSVDSQSIPDFGSFKQAGQTLPSDYLQKTTRSVPKALSFHGSTTKSVHDNDNNLMDSSISDDMVSSIFTERESILQFQRGMEEASKFLPKNNQLFINLDSYALPPQTNNGPPKVVTEMESESRENSPNGSRGKRSHHSEDGFKDERTSKQSAVFEEETELSELFDRVLLCPDVKAERRCCNEQQVKIEPLDNPQVNGHQPNGNNKKFRAKKQGKNDMVDISTLLISCAQSVAADDRSTANEQLKNIRQHCSPLGDGSQRVANIFANALKARLGGTVSQKYADVTSKRISATEMLKAYQTYVSRCPFKKLSMIFSNKSIYDLAMGSSKKKLHIIDFGICYGFQWPILIQFLSTLPGGAPELKITGIEFPLPGFRPADLVEETGRRLVKYCERFNVKVQYQPIAQKWETIRIEDLNLAGDEDIVVNCLFRFKNLLDESVSECNPRDSVLTLIKKINPDIFISHTLNASFNSPFFVTRFREALFYYSSYFDMLDTVIPRENQQRTNFEQEFFGREVMNIIACEGMERVERPETYKQWQFRYKRAGFKILPLKEDLLEKLKGKMAGYHKDFVTDEDGKWFLQGWKGRIFCASSCWVRA